MSKRTTLQLLIALALVATALVLFLLTRDEGGPASETPVAVEPSTAFVVDAPLLGSIPAAVDPSESAIRVPATHPIATAEDDSELRDAIWVEGRVVLPSGTPPDEHVEVIARGKPFERRQPYRTAPAPDGSFRVAFKNGTTAGILMIDARYLYFDSGKVFDPSRVPTPIVLQPKLGGVICGQVRTPEGNVAMRDALQDSVVNATGNLESSGRWDGGIVERSSKLGQDGRFEIKSLPPMWLYRVDVQLDQFTTQAREGVVVKPGQVVDVDLDVIGGATIRGRVVDEAGLGIESTPINCWSSGRSSSSGTREVKSGVDGTFEIAGVYPGPVSILAGAEGMNDAWIELKDLRDGEVRTGVQVVLTRILPIIGRVQWPDGKPASGCKVDYSYEQTTGRGQSFGQRKVNCDSGGAFRIMEMGGGVFALTARMPMSNEDGSRQSWCVAHREDVKPGTEDIVLVLRPGASVRGTVHDESGKPPARASIVVVRGRSDRPFPGSRSPAPSRVDAVSGEFEISGLCEGEWTVAAEAAGFAMSAPRTFSIPDDGSPIEITLQRNAKVSGNVVDAAGRPVPDARVNIGLRTGNGYQFRGGNGNRSDKDGNFELDAVPPGNVMISGSVRGELGGELYLEIQPGESRAGIRLVLHPEGGPLKSK